MCSFVFRTEMYMLQTSIQLWTELEENFYCKTQKHQNNTWIILVEIMKFQDINTNTIHTVKQLS